MSDVAGSRARISKRFGPYHAAHRLPHHDGGCRRLHGHSYYYEVSVEGWVKPGDGSADEGMVIDFGRLKEIDREFIKPRMDHQFLNNSLADELPGTPIEEGELQGEERLRADGTMALTTAENIAAWIHRTYSEVIQENHQLVNHIRVTVWETETSSAVVR